MEMATKDRASRHWVVSPRLPEDVLGAVSGLSPLQVQLLANRGVRGSEACNLYVQRIEPDTPVMLGVPEAVERITRAVRTDDLIAVHGDYDVDGVSATALMVGALETMGARVIPFIPQRLDDGYGFNVAAVSDLAQRGVRLIVTVDCGVMGHEAVDAARALDIDVVVTDHHLPGDHLPEGATIVNPYQPGCPSGETNLSGVGVAYRLAQGLIGAASDQFLDLVALGTIADLLPVSGRNRGLIHRGLDQLRRHPRPGLLALISLAGGSVDYLSPEDISFTVSPRLNAAGRVAHAMLAYDLLRATTDVDARRMAEQLNQQNQERQRETARALTAARLQLTEQRGARFIVVAGEDWQVGVVGLIAGRLQDETNLPVLALGRLGQFWRGSARSPEGVSLTPILAGAADLFERYGGHAHAAGVSLPIDRLPALRQRLATIAPAVSAEARALRIEARIKPATATRETYELIEQLGPFGKSNPRPILLVTGARVLRYRPSMNGSHVNMTLETSEGGTLGVIGFHLGSRLPELFGIPAIDAVGTLELGRSFDGAEPDIIFKLLDFRPASRW